MVFALDGNVQFKEVKTKTQSCCKVPEHLLFFGLFYFFPAVHLGGRVLQGMRDTVNGCFKMQELLGHGWKHAQCGVHTAYLQ